jgi:diacylglycerol kinase family enzyme
MPFGTTNMNAKALNGSGNRRHAVAALRQAVTTGQFKSQQRSLLQVSFMQDNLSLDKQVEHREYGFFLGVGVIARLVERWDQQRRPGGAINQMRSLMAMVTSLRTASIPTDIRLNGHNYSVYGLLATTLDRLLFGSQPFWGTALGGSLRLTWIESSARNILRHIPAVLRGQAHLQNVPGFASMAADCTSLEFEGPYIIDGEIFYSNAETNAEKLTISRSAPIQWLRLDSS